MLKVTFTSTETVLFEHLGHGNQVSIDYASTSTSNEIRSYLMHTWQSNLNQRNDQHNRNAIRDLRVQSLPITRCWPTNGRARSACHVTLAPPMTCQEGATPLFNNGYLLFNCVIFTREQFQIQDIDTRDHEISDSVECAMRSIYKIKYTEHCSQVFIAGGQLVFGMSTK